MTLLQDSSTLKTTPLFSRHQSLNAKMTDFGGWNMPVYYSSILEEHNWTRQNCGIFDVSHLGEFHLKGKGAFEYLQRRLSNDLRKLKPGHIQYHLLCNEQGFVLDDILVYMGGEDNYFIVVNAGNIEKDYAFLLNGAPKGVELENNSGRMACIAVQGPLAEKVMKTVLDMPVADMPYYTFQEFPFGSSEVWVSRSGYTGEDGFEIFAGPDSILSVWDKLIGEGKEKGILPCGLGARNTLRLEAGNPLYGHEMDDKTTPLEAGLAFAVSFDKGTFTGSEALLKQKNSGLAKKLVGFKMLDKSIARDGYAIQKDGRRVGHVASGSFAPTVGVGIGMGFVETALASVGNKIEIELHGRLAAAEIVKRPFVAMKHKK